MCRVATGIVVLLIIGQTVHHHAQAADILFMYNPANPDLDDFLAEWMTDLGHNVEFYDTSLVTDPDEQIDLALEADLVFVAESLGSGSTHDGVDTYIKDVPTPQIWAEAYAWDEAAMTGDFQFEDFGNTQRANPDEDPIEDLIDGQTEIHITNPDHPMAAGFADAVQVYEDDYSVNWGLVESMGAGVTVIASLTPAAEYAALFVYDEGAELEDGTLAAEKRIGLYLGQAGLGASVFDNIHGNGLQLFEAAINYAIGGPPNEPGDFNANGVLDAEDIDLLSAEVQNGNNNSDFDLNDDSLVNNADRIAWVNDLRNTWFGDANLDGEFNSGDLVAVFTAGEYEDGLVGNSGWSSGDWNGDAEFGSGDLVVAFQEGGFEQGPHVAGAMVPEPATATTLVMGAIAISLMRRKR